MFSGIIQTTAPVSSSKLMGEYWRVRIQNPARWKLRDGQSISVDGICSTVIKHAREFFEVEYIPETLSKTTAGLLAQGSAVNLERPLRFGDYIGSHFVQGHVDARGRVVEVVKDGQSRALTISVPQALARNIALHGSIAVNGTGLTVARLPRTMSRQAGKREASFTVALTSYTLAHTNLGRLQVGDEVNVETDLTARHLFAALNQGNPRSRISANHKRGRDGS